MVWFTVPIFFFCLVGSPFLQISFLSLFDKDFGMMRAVGDVSDPENAMDVFWLQQRFKAVHV